MDVQNEPDPRIDPPRYLPIVPIVLLEGSTTLRGTQWHQRPGQIGELSDLEALQGTLDELRASGCIVATVQLQIFVLMSPEVEARYKKQRSAGTGPTAQVQDPAG